MVARRRVCKKICEKSASRFRSQVKHVVLIYHMYGRYLPHIGKLWGPRNEFVLGSTFQGVATRSRRPRQAAAPRGSRPMPLHHCALVGCTRNPARVAVLTNTNLVRFLPSTSEIHSSRIPVRTLLDCISLPQFRAKPVAMW